MAEPVKFMIGAEARCTDGACGRVTRVVLDPIARALTDVVITPPHRPGLGRLVPLDLIDEAAEVIRLRCTLAEFEQLDSAEETQFLRGPSNYDVYSPEHIISWPYYGMGGAGGVTGVVYPEPVQTVTYDAVPLGEVDIRRGDHVHATDGSIGRVDGLVVDPRNRHVTHVLLQEGHLWGRKEVAIPITAVNHLGDLAVHLSITKQEVGDLPPVSIDRTGYS
jgi:sporulation protein YlmC with PRC-barrel domain